MKGKKYFPVNGYEGYWIKEEDELIYFIAVQDGNIVDPIDFFFPNEKEPKVRYKRFEQMVSQWRHSGALIHYPKKNGVLIYSNYLSIFDEDVKNHCKFSNIEIQHFTWGELMSRTRTFILNTSEMVNYRDNG